MQTGRDELLHNKLWTESSCYLQLHECLHSERYRVHRMHICHPPQQLQTLLQSCKQNAGLKFACRACCVTVSCALLLVLLKANQPAEQHSTAPHQQLNTKLSAVAGVPDQKQSCRAEPVAQDKIRHSPAHTCVAIAVRNPRTACCCFGDDNS